MRACVDAGAVSVGGIPLHLRRGVREHFMSWLADARPDLVDQYDQRYGGRAYLPVKEREDVGRMVRGAVRRAGGLAEHPRTQLTPSAPSARPTASTDPSPPQPDVTQLDLAL
ncbi:MAG: hypothetical protein QOK43_172 [Acidimicrobiaceae bacterium]|nr:hypothetical protein [Acidimicrobiaceae bacterium]